MDEVGDAAGGLARRHAPKLVDEVLGNQQGCHQLPEHLRLALLIPGQVSY